MRSPPDFPDRSASSNATAAVIGDGDANMHLRQTPAHVVFQASKPLGILASLTMVFLISTELRLRRFEATSEQAAACAALRRHQPLKVLGLRLFHFRSITQREESIVVPSHSSNGILAVFYIYAVQPTATTTVTTCASYD